MLILSGGGAKGAFGAGFLVGWGEVTDPRFARPAFDLVTGVSTGSLIAPLAFVGDAESYELANQIYRNPKTDWIKERSLLSVLLDQDSLFDDDGLLNEIRTDLGPRISTIAAQTSEHRLLLVGTTNLNQGNSQAWNMTELATQVVDGTITEEEFCRTNLSSASIPLVFPPQVIGGNVYVDGSTTRDIFYTTAFDAPDGALAKWRAQYPGEPLPKVRIWVILNTALVPAPITPDTEDKSVVARSLELAILASLHAQLKVLDLGTQVLRDRMGCDIEMHFVSLPDGWTQKGKGMFNKDDMDSMSDVGMAMGRDPSSWQTTIADPLAPEWVRDELERTLRAQEERKRGEAPSASVDR